MANINQQSFSNNKPTKGKSSTTLTSRDGLMLDSKGGQVSKKRRVFEGEIIELQKIHYGASSVSELLDRSFNEITKTRDNISPENFFNLYNQLFYDIPKDGKQSHTSLIEDSTDYIGGYEDPKGEKINSLIDRVVDLETTALQNPGENSLFRNGTIIRKTWQYGIMQEGKLRLVANEGDPNPLKQMKKLLGKTDADGKVLSSHDASIEVSTETWNSIPKWPVGTMIKNQSDWNLSLKSFDIAESNITICTANIDQSELDSLEITFLIDKLKNKTPFEGFTIEDNFNGSITYTDSELAPFDSAGTSEGEEKQWYTGGGIDGRIAPNSSIRFRKAADQIIAYWEARDDKGLYGLGDWNEGGYGFFQQWGHMTPEEQEERRSKNEQRALAAINDYYSSNKKKNRLLKEYGSAIKLVLAIKADGGVISYNHVYKRVDTHEYGTDWKSQMIEDLVELKSEINEGKFKYYIWGVDFNRSYNQSELTDGIKIFNGKYYWVDKYKGRSENGVRRWMKAKIDERIAEQKAIYGRHNKLVEIERLIKG